MKIKITTPLLTSLVIILGGIFYSRNLIIVDAVLFSSIIMHELGHIIVHKLAGHSISALGIGVINNYVELAEQEVWAIDDLLGSFAGPAMNLMIAILTTLVIIYSPEDFAVNFPFRSIIEINLLIGLVNLIPFKGSDGRHILDLIMAMRTDEEITNAI